MATDPPTAEGKDETTPQTKADESKDSPMEGEGSTGSHTKDTKHVQFGETKTENIPLKGPLATTPIASQVERGRGSHTNPYGAAAEEHAKTNKLREASVIRSEEKVLQEWKIPITDGNDIPRIVDDLKKQYGDTEGHTLEFVGGGMVLHVFQYVHTRELSELASTWWTRKQALRSIAEDNEGDGGSHTHKTASCARTEEDASSADNERALKEKKEPDDIRDTSVDTMVDDEDVEAREMDIKRFLARRDVILPNQCMEHLMKLKTYEQSFIVRKVKPRRGAEEQEKEYKRVTDMFTEIPSLERQAKGWCRVQRAWRRDDKRSLPENQWARMDLFKRMIDDLAWDMDIQMLVCGLDTATFDLFTDSYDPYTDSYGRIEGKTISYLKSLIRGMEQRDRDKPETLCWWEDDTAASGSEGTGRGSKRGRERRSSPSTRGRGGGGSSGSYDASGGRTNVRLASGPGRRPDEPMDVFLARRTYEEGGRHAGSWADAWAEQMETFGTKGKGRGKPHTKDLPPNTMNPNVSTETRAAIEHETLAQVRQRISRTTTDDWTADIRDSLDDKNVRRLARMAPMAQDTVIRFYKRPDDVRNPQGHIASTIKGLRFAMEDGVTYEECVRIQQLAGGGIKMSYRPCTWYGQGTCHRGDQCHHVHTMGIHTHSDSAKGKGKGKRGMDDEEYGSEFLNF